MIDYRIASDLESRKLYISDGWRVDWPIRYSDQRIGFDTPERWPLRWRAYVARALAGDPDPVLLSVTGQDIAESELRRYYRQRADLPYQSDRDCPLGIALARTFGVEHARAHPDYLTRAGRERAHMPIIDSDGRKRGSVYELPIIRYRATAAIRAYMRQWDRRGRAAPKRFRLIPLD